MYSYIQMLCHNNFSKMYIQLSLFIVITVDTVDSINSFILICISQRISNLSFYVQSILIHEYFESYWTLFPLGMTLYLSEVQASVEQLFY